MQMPFMSHPKSTLIAVSFVLAAVVCFNWLTHAVPKKSDGLNNASVRSEFPAAIPPAATPIAPFVAPAESREIETSYEVQLLHGEATYNSELQPIELPTELSLDNTNAEFNDERADKAITAPVNDSEASLPDPGEGQHAQAPAVYTAKGRVSLGSGIAARGAVLLDKNNTMLGRVNRNGEFEFLNLPDGTKIRAILKGGLFRKPLVSDWTYISGADIDETLVLVTGPKVAVRAAYPYPLVVNPPIACTIPRRLTAAEIEGVISEAYRLMNFNSITYNFGSKFTVGSPIMQLDCSGFDTEVLRGGGVILNQNLTNVAALKAWSQPLWNGPVLQCLPGSFRGAVVCFSTPTGDHCGIMLDQLNFIHCSATRGKIAVDNLAAKSPFAQSWGYYVTKIGAAVK